MRKRITALATAVTLLTGCAGQGNGTSVQQADEPPATAPADVSAPAAATVSVGKTLAVKTEGVTANWTVTKVEAKPTDQYDTEPANGGRWVLVHVKAAVKDGRDAYVCGCDLSFIAKSGKVYEQAFANFKARPELNGANVAPGQNADGWVVFDVAPDDLKGARIQLKQTAILDDAAFGYWTLPDLTR